jgi:hypothetical protein
MARRRLAGSYMLLGGITLLSMGILLLLIRLLANVPHMPEILMACGLLALLVGFAIRRV